MSWHYLPGPADHCLPATCTDGEPLPLLKSKTTHAEFYCNGKLTDAYLDSLSGMTYAPSTESRGAEKSTSSQAASHAQTSAQPEEAQASKAKQAASGQKWQGLSMRFDRDTSTLKTVHSLFSEDLPLSCVTLPPWGMMQDGELWAPITLPRLISGEGYGLWPTPTQDAAQERSQKYSQGGTSISTAVKLWPTPIHQDGKHGNPTEWELTVDHCATKNSLRVKAYKATYPTPTSRDYKDNCGHIIAPRKDGKSRLDHLPRVIKEVGQLSASWVEWLMGWPIGWTDLAPLNRDDFKRWRDLTLSGEWFTGDPADVIRSDISAGAKIVPRVSSGVKNRAKRLKAIGNGQVPICAAVAFEMLTE